MNGDDCPHMNDVEKLSVSLMDSPILVSWSFCLSLSPWLRAWLAHRIPKKQLSRMCETILQTPNWENGRETRSPPIINPWSWMISDDLFLIFDCFSLKTDVCPMYVVSQHNCFPPNQVVFVLKPYQTTRTVLWQLKIEVAALSVVYRNVHWQLILVTGLRGSVVVSNVGVCEELNQSTHSEFSS